MGEGGAVFTNNSKIKAMRSFRDWGRDCYCAPGKDNTCGRSFREVGGLPDGYDHKYTYSHLGYNLKVTDMQAACALGQLTHLDDFVERRRSNFAYLNDRSVYGRICAFASCFPKCKSVLVRIAISLKENSPVSRNQVVQLLNSRGIDTRLLFAGNVTKQPYFEGCEFREATDLSVTDYVMKNTFWVGLHHGLSRQHLDHTISVMTEIFSSDFESLLTGASGSLGQQVLISLLKHDHAVACIINRNTPTLSAIDQDRVTFLKKQLVLNWAEDKLEPFDCIIHCATKYGRNSENEENIRECNLELPIKLLRSAMLRTDGLFINSDTFFNSSIELSGTMNFYTATKSELRDILSEDEFAGKYKIVNAVIYQMFGLDDDESNLFRL